MQYGRLLIFFANSSNDVLEVNEHMNETFARIYYVFFVCSYSVTYDHIRGKKHPAKVLPNEKIPETKIASKNV